MKEAVTVARLAEDMELELAELFPKQSDLRLLVVRLLLLLQTSSERKPSELADMLEVERYVLSRLLTKLEMAHYITRRRDGNDKIVNLFIAQNHGQAPQIEQMCGTHLHYYTAHGPGALVLQSCNKVTNESRRP